MFRSSRSARLPLSAIFGLLGLGLVLALRLQPAAAAPLVGDPALMLQVSAEQSLFDLTNADRMANGLPPLTNDPDLLGIARQRALSQLGQAPLNHYDADGSLTFVHLLTAASVSYQLAGENLARAAVADATVTERIEQALMKSPTHRKNILEKGFTRVAIGVAIEDSGQITFAEIYRN